MGFFIDFLISGVAAVIQRFFQDMVALFSGVIAQEHQLAMEILNHPFVANATSAMQIIAGSLLAVKVAIEVFQHYILFSSGENSVGPMKLLQRVPYAAALIAGGPFIAREVFNWGAVLAIAISQVPIAGDAQDNIFIQILERSLVGAVVTNMAFSIMLIFTLIFWLLVVIQTVIRAVELAFISVSGPIMAIGLTRFDEGVWAAWWRELLVLSLSQAVQMFFLTGFFSSLQHIMDSGVLEISFSSMLLPIAWLFVAFKSPTVLKQYAYHTGVGNTGANVARSYISPIIKNLTTKRPG